MHLLKQDTPFVWDETAQLAFEALKKALLSAPLLRPPDYSRDFILYLVASESTIGVVLVQEDDKLIEHVIYYLSRALARPELRYSHVEKIALAVVYAISEVTSLHFTEDHNSSGGCESVSICFVLMDCWGGI